jgi:catechol 2,3-dioxygenase-like lactoylglutathione lyase family enzyme
MTAMPSIDTAPLVTADLTPPRLSEVVLRTSRYAEMKAWYQQVLGVKPFFEHTPPEWESRRAQLTERLPGDLRLCFMRIASGYPFGQVVALFDYPGQQPSLQASGMHHMQLRHGSLEDLFTRFERLAGIGLQPYKSFNHGPSTSFYYQDVDSNMVELSAANFATEQEFVAFMKSAAYAANPAGHAVDPAELVRRWRAGEAAADIVRIAH